MNASRSLFERHLEEHRRVTDRLSRLSPEIERASDEIVRCLGDEGRVLLLGNGGSMADAIHIEGELRGRFRFDRAPLAAVALGTGASSLTAIANDYGYEHVFEREIRALGRRGDVAIAISTSGRSPNVVRAVKAAREIGVVTIGFLGGDGGELAALCDIALVVPSDSTPIVQEHHILIGHVLCDLAEKRLFAPATDVQAK